MSAANYEHLIHPLLRYRRKEIPPEANAFACWQAGICAVANPDEVNELPYAFDRDCECGLVECISCQPPSKAELTARLTALLKLNAEAIRCFDDGIRRGQLQVSIEPLLNLEGGLSLSGLRDLARLKFCQGQLHAIQGDFNAVAVANFERVLAGRMLADCDGSIVTFLIGVAVQKGAISQLLELAEDPASSTPQLLACLHAARDARIDDVAAVGVLRSEFCNWTLPILKSLADVDSNGILDHAADYFARELPSGTDDAFSESAIAHSKFYRRAFFDLLQGHPQLWDAHETLRVASLTTAKQIAEIMRNDASLPEIEQELAPWQACDEAFWSEWPESLGPFSMLAAMCDDWTPPPEWELNAARDRLQRFDNPLGHIVVGLVCSDVNPHAVQTMHQPALDERLSALLD